MGGTLRELPKSKRTGERRWELRVFTGRAPAADGGEKQGPVTHVSRVFRGGKREAQRALDALVTEVGAERRTGTRATVGKLLDEWLANLGRLGKARSTVDTYKIHVAKHIRPALGPLRLDKLTGHDLDTYFAALEAKGLAPSTIRLNHAIVSAALSQGVKWGWLTANPAKQASLADKVTVDNPALTVEQLRRLYTTAAAEDEDMAATIALAALTGCRRGELCGLRWDDVDWERACLRVERQWVPGAGGQHLTTATKTGKGRTVFVGELGLALLDAYKAQKAALIGREPSGWLLSADGGTTPLRAKGLTDYVTGLGKRLGIPLHLHSLRHFAASSLVAGGTDLPTAARQLGHSVGVMSSVYLHTDDTRAAAAGELMAGVVRQAVAPNGKSPNGG